jgi:hypothetical protein
MKKKLLLSTLITSALLIAPVSYADNTGLRICEYIKANDKSRLRTYLKQNKIKIKNIFDEMRCNKQDLIVFSASNQSLEVGEFIIGKIPVRKVGGSYDETFKYSAHLAEAVKKRSSK